MTEKTNVVSPDSNVSTTITVMPMPLATFTSRMVRSNFDVSQLVMVVAMPCLPLHTHKRHTTDTQR